MKPLVEVGLCAEAIKIKASKKIAFRASKDLKEAVI